MKRPFDGMNHNTYRYDFGFLIREIANRVAVIVEFYSSKSDEIIYSVLLRNAINAIEIAEKFNGYALTIASYEVVRKLMNPEGSTVCVLIEFKSADEISLYAQKIKENIILA